jgi:hypothetical protein
MKWMDTSLLAYVPAGEFSLGGAVADFPAHRVALDPYWIQQTEVTNGMYAQCVAAGACTAPVEERGAPLYTNTDYASYPVVGVNWDQASTYCTWTGGRLPTEAEWEKAARGSSDNTYPWGQQQPTCDLANFGGCLKHTSPVTDYPEGRSSFGLYDMVGNVFEWMGDWYSDTYYNESPAMNPAGPDSGEYRVIRGSSFETTPEDGLDPAIRHYMSPSNTKPDVGFRCVVTQPKALAPYCQQSAYVPGVSPAQQGQCELPAVDVRGQYCSGEDSYVTVNIPDGASYSLNRKDYTCEESVVDGKRLLTCKGPRYIETSVDVTVCNDACTTTPSQAGSPAACDPGYALDTNSGTCVYSPIPAAAGLAGCPAGYTSIDRGGTKTCALAPGADGQCPAGLYLDDLYGACVSASGSVDIPYGISNPDLAQQAYAGCPTGSEYEPSFQCCQASSSAAYPACPPGTTFNADSKACVPSGVRQSSVGCVTAQAITMKCAEPVNICSKITKENLCIGQSNFCTWDDKANLCLPKK